MFEKKIAKTLADFTSAISKNVSKLNEKAQAVAENVENKKKFEVVAIDKTFCADTSDLKAAKEFFEAIADKTITLKSSEDILTGGKVLVATDDQNLIKLLRPLKIPYITSAMFEVILSNKKAMNNAKSDLISAAKFVYTKLATAKAKVEVSTDGISNLCDYKLYAEFIKARDAEGLFDYVYECLWDVFCIDFLPEEEQEKHKISPEEREAGIAQIIAKWNERFPEVEPEDDDTNDSDGSNDEDDNGVESDGNETPKDTGLTAEELKLKFGEENFLENVNTAAIEDLCELPCIGPKRSRMIHQYILENGEFKSFIDFAEYLKLKSHEIEKLKDYMYKEE